MAQTSALHFGGFGSVSHPMFAGGGQLRGVKGVAFAARKDFLCQVRGFPKEALLTSHSLPLNVLPTLALAARIQL